MTDNGGVNDLDAAVRRLDRDTPWRLDAAVPVNCDVGHPQGITPWGEHWLVSTVRWERAAGALLVLDASGELVDSLDVTDGERFHPGGLDRSGDGCWAAVAEYRPGSTTTVMWIDEHLDATTAFRFPDHLGAICQLDDSTLFAVSWGSRTWYRLDVDGRVLDAHENVSAVVDLQDLQSLPGRQVVGTGVGSIATPHGPLQLGAVLIIDPDDLRLAFETPVAAWMPSGRVATYNATHLTARTGPGGPPVPRRRHHRRHRAVDRRTPAGGVMDVGRARRTSVPQSARVHVPTGTTRPYEVAFRVAVAPGQRGSVRRGLDQGHLRGGAPQVAMVPRRRMDVPDLPTPPRCGVDGARMAAGTGLA